MANVENSKKSSVEATSLEDPVVPGQKCSNPMLNSLVLQTLFEHASITEMKTYRQVCKLWWEESLPQWRHRVWIRMNDNGGEKSLPMFRYLEMLSSSSDPFQFAKHPYRKFNLNVLQNRTVDKAEMDELFTRQFDFWRKCGPTMTHLEISTSTIRCVDDFEAILFRFLPKLVCLDLSDVYVVDRRLDEIEKTYLKEAPSESINNSFEELTIWQSWQELLPVSWTRLLSHFPGIKRLSITINQAGFQPYSPGGELADILSAMITLARDEGISWKLEKLDLLMMGEPRAVVLESRHSDLFRELQLPLTSLCLHIGVGTPRSVLRSILETCAFTLRKLMVYAEGLTLNDVGEEDFPYGVQLDTLSELWLSGRLLCDNLNFLPFTPNLTSLILAQDVGASLRAAESYVSGHPSWFHISCMLSQDEIDTDGHLREASLSILRATDFSQLEHAVFPKLKEFIVSGRQETVCFADSVAALARLMPNLNTLMLGLGNDGFRVVCKAWKQLEVLIVQPYQVDQFGLTGTIPLLKHRLPNLTDLTRLRYFGMGFESGEQPERNLSKESVLNAIFPLKNLQGITAVYNLDTIGVEVRDQLLSKFPNSKIHEDDEDVEEWEFAENILNYIVENEGTASGSEVDSNQEEEYSDSD